MVSFLTSYAEEHTILLPGRVPGYKRAHIQLLPTSTTEAVRLLYQAMAGTKDIAHPTSFLLWRQLIPHILVMKPMADLCWVCQTNATAVMMSINMTKADKATVPEIMLALCGTCMCVGKGIHAKQ